MSRAREPWCQLCASRQSKMPQCLMRRARAQAYAPLGLLPYRQGSQHQDGRENGEGGDVDVPAPVAWTDWRLERLVTVLVVERSREYWSDEHGHEECAVDRKGERGREIETLPRERAIQPDQHQCNDPDPRIAQDLAQDVEASM